ncbi:hypothetical protein CR513_20990, partial [Mucuna pruriens]
MDRSMIDTASGGALMDKTLAVVRNLISNMASNTQQFGVRGVVASKVVNETILNPQANVSVITLRSGKELPQKQAMSKTAKGKVAQLVINDTDTNVVA